MTDLTSEELAIVAREVTESDCFVETEDGSDYVITPDGVWNPTFTGTPRSRSQALACVEHLIDAIWKRYAAVDSLGKDWLLEQLANVAHAIRDKDTTALQRMVLELRNPK